MLRPTAQPHTKNGHHALDTNTPFMDDKQLSISAAGYDLPYVQAQVGHLDPSTTLAIYAQVMARRDRDQLRAEIRQLLGVDVATGETTAPTGRLTPPRGARRGPPSGL